jgi:hypothetical protein
VALFSGWDLANRTEDVLISKMEKIEENYQNEFLFIFYNLPQQ